MDLNNIIKEIISFVSGFGIVGGFLLIILESIIPIFPLALFIGINVLSFGKIVGFSVSFIGTIIGAVLSFLLFRKFFNKKLDKFIRNKKEQNYVKLLVNKFTNIKLVNLALIVAIPFAPAFLINIAAGLSNMSFKKFLIAILIGKISIIYFWGYIGTTFLESIKNPIIMLKLFVLMLVVYILSKILIKILNIEEK